MSIFDEDDYRIILSMEYDRRHTHNSKYSLRAYARDLELSPSKLSEILNKKQGLSVLKGRKIAKCLSFNNAETEFFCLLIESLHARSDLGKKSALLKLRKFHVLEVKEMRNDLFEILSSWEHLAIMEAIELTGAKSTPKWIAQTLASDEKKIQECIERLLRFGLVIKDGKKIKRATKALYSWGENITSSSIQNFHKDILLRSIEALFTAPLDQKDFRSTIMPINSKDIPLVEEKIKEVSFALNKLLTKSKKKDRVYVFSCQFFPLSHL